MVLDSRRIAAQRLPLLPGRSIANGPRTGAALGSAAQQAGDCFWKCGVEVFKPVYTRIDRQFPITQRLQSEQMKEDHRSLMDEAKKILQEHRNLIFEAVLPMFAVSMRRSGEEAGEADAHAHDYIIQNVWAQMVDTLIASLDSFVDKQDVLQVESTVSKLADVQKKRLAGLLLNFTFKFRPVVAPRNGKIR